MASETPKTPNLTVTLIALIVLAGVLMLVAWFVWSLKTQKPAPTSPSPTSNLRMRLPHAGLRARA